MMMLRGWSTWCTRGGFALSNKEKEQGCLTITREIMTGLKEKCFLNEDGKALEQAAQGSCQITILGDAPKILVRNLSQLHKGAE